MGLLRLWLRGCTILARLASFLLVLGLLVSPLRWAAERLSERGGEGLSLLWIAAATAAVLVVGPFLVVLAARVTREFEVSNGHFAVITQAAGSASAPRDARAAERDAPSAREHREEP